MNHTNYSANEGGGELHRQASEYARRGWRVFPVWPIRGGRCACGRDCGNSAGKHPMIRDWDEKATTDQQLIGQWWTINPDANIGIATG